MAIAHRSGSQAFASSAGLTATGTMPTGGDAPQAGDLIFLQITRNIAGATISTPPSDYTLIRHLDDGTTNLTSLYYKIAAGGEGNPQATLGASSKWTFIIQIYSGVDQTDPFHNPMAENGAAEGTNTASHVTPTVNNPDSNSWAIAAFSLRGGSAITWTHAVLTERADVTTTSSSQISASVADSNGTVASGNQSYTGVSSATSSNATMWLGFLKAASTGTTHDGAATMSFTIATAHTSSVVEKIGSASISFSLPVSASGVKEKVGSASISFSLPVSTSGVIEKVGDVQEIEFFFAIEADWRVTVTGAASMSFTFSTAASGVAESVASASIPVSFPISATGVREKVAAATITTSFTLAASALREAVGAATLTFAIGTAASGHRTANAAATLPVTFTVFADGEIEGAPIDGVANLQMTFSIAATGERTTFGAATITSAFAIAAAGVPEKVGAVLPIPVTFSIVGVGERTAIGAATIPFGFTIFADGRTDAIDGAATLTIAFTTSALGQVQRVDSVTKTRIFWTPLAGLLTSLGARTVSAPLAKQGAQLPRNPIDMRNRGAAGGTRGRGRQGAEDEGPP